LTNWQAIGRLTPFGGRYLADATGTTIPLVGSSGIRLVFLGVMNQPADGVTLRLWINGEEVFPTQSHDTPADPSGLNQTSRPAMRVAVYEYPQPLVDSATYNLTAEPSDGATNGWCVDIYSVNPLNASSPTTCIEELYFASGYGDRFGDDPGLPPLTYTVTGAGDTGPILFLAGASPNIAFPSIGGMVQIPPDGTPTTTAIMAGGLDDTESGDVVMGFGVIDSTPFAESISAVTRIGIYRGGGGDEEPLGQSSTLTYESGRECYLNSAYAGQPFVTTFDDFTDYNEDVKFGNIYHFEKPMRIVGARITLAQALPTSGVGITRAPSVTEDPGFIEFAGTLLYTFATPTGLVEGDNVLMIPEEEQFEMAAGDRIVLWYDLPDGATFYRTSALGTPVGSGLDSDPFGIPGWLMRPSFFNDPYDWTAADFGISELYETFPNYLFVCEPNGPDYAAFGGLTASVYVDRDESNIQWLPVYGQDANFDWVFPGESTWSEEERISLTAFYYDVFRPGQIGSNVVWDYSSDDVPAPFYTRRVEAIATVGDSQIHHLFGSPDIDTTYHWPMVFEIATGVGHSPSGLNPATNITGFPDDNGSQPWLFHPFNSTINFTVNGGGSVGSNLLPFLRNDQSIGIPPPGWDVNFAPDRGYEQAGINSPLTSMYHDTVPPGTLTIPFPHGTWGFPVEQFDPTFSQAHEVAWFMVGLKFKANLTAVGLRTQVQIIG